MQVQQNKQLQKGERYVKKKILFDQFINFIDSRNILTDLQFDILRMYERNILAEQVFNPKLNVCMPLQYQTILPKNQHSPFQQPSLLHMRENTPSTPLKIKNIPSSEQIEEDIQSCKNIRQNINSDIDDLFKKISQLSNSLESDIKPNIGNNVKNKIIETSVYTKQKLSIQNTKSAEFFSKNQDNQTVGSQNHLNIFSVIQIQNGIKVRDFQIGNRIGYGKFGQTLQTRHRQTGFCFAIKKIFKSIIHQYMMEDQILIEIECLKRLNHPNIIKGYASFTDEFHVFIVMEYAFGVSLIQRLNMSERQASKIIKQVLQAIDHMHKNGVVHRDIKPQNIIIGQCGDIKICDFGWASRDLKDMDITCGTLDYITPEMANSSAYSKETDLWSVGVLTYELIYGKAPFKGKDHNAVKEKVKNLDFTFPEQIEISDNCKNFIQGYLTYQSERKSLTWGLEHQFIKKQSQNNQQLLQQFSLLL